MYRMTAETAVRLNAVPASRPLSAKAPVQPTTTDLFADEAEELDVLLQDIFDTAGFGVVVRLCAEAQKRLASNNRAAVDAQGWVV